MPLKNYGVLKGRAVDRRLASGANAHYQVKLVDDEFEWRIAVNVQSSDGSKVEYAVISHFVHPITDALQSLETGFSPLPASEAGGLDYIRGNLIDPRFFVPLPMNLPGPDNDLNEKLEHYIQRAMADENATIYAFGETWGPESKRDKIFGFLPGRGIHDIHMNQGNSGNWKKDNGIWQDGGIIMSFPNTTTQWVAIFLKFQTQAWHTNDTTGHPIETPVSGPPSDTEESGRIDEDSLPTPEHPDGLVRIIAALVNDVKSPEQETVTLLNTSNEDIDLDGWNLLDSAKKRLPLQGLLPKGGTRMFEVRPAIQLSNQGGIITLLNPEGIKVHGVSYTRKQAQNPGWTITFC
jgi:uncharacterized protein YukJ